MIVGWKGYVRLPEIQPAAIRAKLDTGALTSSLDARDIKTFWVGGAEHVEFRLAPPRSSTLEGPLCRVPVIDRRVVRNSGGHEESRIIILSTIVLAEQTIQTEFSLTRRDPMNFRVLIGRRSLAALNVAVSSTEHSVLSETSLDVNP